MKILIALGVGLLTAAIPVAADIWIELRAPEPYELQVKGFELPRPARVRIDAVGMWHPRASWAQRWWWGGDDEQALSVYAWILDAATREPVWTMALADTSRMSRNLRRARDDIRLGPGRYELYFFSGNAWLADAQAEAPATDAADWWRRWVSDGRGDPAAWREDLRACGLSLSSDDVAAGALSWFEVIGGFEDAVVALRRLGDARLEVRGLELVRPATLRVYSVYEHPEQGADPADYGWIVNAETRERVWHPRGRPSRAAGGGEKNRRLDDRISLEAGRYLVYFGTDDSHSVERFNVNPPSDPLNWGVVVAPATPADADALRAFEAPDLPAPLYEFVAAGDGAATVQPFRLQRDGRLHVRAVGEYSARSDRFVDGAWIVDASSGRTVWKMDAENTFGAGGATKNRVFDGLVELAAGEFVLYYATDDSHAFGDWNAGPPFDPAAWGVSLRPGPRFDPRGFVLLSPGELDAGGALLARLVGVGDGERRSERFTLTERTAVRIRALGEGSRGEMFDYGYIVDTRSGRRVWEMSFEQTAHAGGADKNRVVDEELELPPGDYEAVFVSDESHSAAGWNAAGPDDRLGWGLTVRRLGR